MATEAGRERQSVGLAPVLRLLAAVLLLLLLAIAYHEYLVLMIGSTGLRLGALDLRHAVPLHARWDPRASGLTLPAALLLASIAFAGARLVASRLGPARFVTLAIGLFVASALLLAESDGPKRSWDGRTVSALVWPYTRAHKEYYGDVPRIEERGLRRFLGAYPRPRLFEELSDHSRTHPPGGIVFLWGAAQLLGRGLWPAALATVAFASLALVPLYFGARAEHDEATARIAVLMLALTPNVLMFSATSMDGPFSVMPAVGYWLFRASTRGRDGPALLSGLAFAASAFMTYASVVVVLCVLLSMAVDLARRGRPGLRSSLRRAAAMAAGFLAFYAILFATTGFNPIAAVQASFRHDEATMGTGYETPGRYLQVSVANLAAFLIGSGLATTALWLGVATRALRSAFAGAWSGAETVPFAVCLPIIAFSTLFTLETERVWLLAVPFLVVPAAKALRGGIAGPSGVTWVLLLLALQAWASELLLATDW